MIYPKATCQELVNEVHEAQSGAKFIGVPDTAWQYKELNDYVDKLSYLRNELRNRQMFAYSHDITIVIASLEEMEKAYERRFGL